MSAHRQLSSRSRISECSRMFGRLVVPLSCAVLLLFSACAGSGSGGSSHPPTATTIPTPIVPSAAKASITYTGHKGPVIAAAWSPDGQRIASCGNDGTLQVWNPKTGQKLWGADVAAYVFALAWSPDGRRIAAAGSGGTDSIHVLDAATGHELTAFGDQSGLIEGLAWSPDGKRIASGSQDNTVKVWNAQTGAAMLTYSGHSEAVAHVAWSPDGTRIASASHDGTVQMWDATTGKTLLSYKGNAAPVWSVAWSPDGKRIASGTGSAGINGPVVSNNAVKVWDVATGQTLLTLADTMGQSYALAWSPDGSRIAAGDGQLVRVWDAASGKPMVQYTGHSEDVFAVAWSPDGTLVATTSVDGTVQVWRPQV